MVKIDQLPGRVKKKRGIAKESKERTLRRTVHQVGDAMLHIVLHLVNMDAMPKVPLEQASDCVSLALFLSGLFLSGCSYHVACILFLCARHIRTPSLMHELMVRSCKEHLKSPSETVSWLAEELKTKPFNQQKTGLPYWTGFTSLHNGPHIFAEWIQPDMQLRLFSAASGLCDYVFCPARVSISECMNRIERLPHAKSYGFDVVRLWVTSLTLCKQQLSARGSTMLKGLKAQRNDEEDETVLGQRMSPHVRILWLLFNRIDGWGKLAQKFGVKRTGLSTGSRSLLCCESQAFFGLLGYVPSQQDLNDKLTLEQYVSKCDLMMLRNLQKYLENPDVALEVCKNVSTCRLEKAEVIKYFPKAKNLKHSSFSAKNFVQSLPKALKVQKRKKAQKNK